MTQLDHIVALIKYYYYNYDNANRSTQKHHPNH